MKRKWVRTAGPGPLKDVLGLPPDERFVTVYQGGPPRQIWVERDRFLELINPADREKWKLALPDRKVLLEIR